MPQSTLKLEFLDRCSFYARNFQLHANFADGLTLYPLESYALVMQVAIAQIFSFQQSVPPR
ncbi:MAG: hypothetical protein NW220_19250 [Leptolyngbyaceae cyanobacterium bins.349]|nr:hypothetical protein [Leptolyngbyaceae cyanobacterium bins.349]